jgi:NADH dehydrogenase/NADH:ubiquinone oxidoreductase subunit G
MAEQQTVQFTLNGRNVTAEPGETVLSVARKNGVLIPTLCHHDAVSANGACRLCVVQVSWGKRSKIVTSCLYTPFENDRVETDTERVRKVRRMVLELLLARCPTVEHIQDLARAYGIERSRFTDGAGPSEERCVLCGLCVRVCDEVVGRHAISHAKRGIQRKITTAFDTQADECIGCGACVRICPTGALHYEDLPEQKQPERVMVELHTRVPLVRCSDCGRAFASPALFEHVSKSINIPPTTLAACPACRSKSFAATAAQNPPSAPAFARAPARTYQTQLLASLNEESS